MSVELFDREAVLTWIDDDPNIRDAQELEQLLKLSDEGDEGASAELADRFSGMLTFGTAGLRGHLGAGPNRMNRAVVIRAAAGLTNYLHSVLPEGFKVVIGYDARYGSHEFALDTAAVVEAGGGHALVFEKALPTPLTAFALRHLDADAAVMVTASHNPPEDNGYKVYLGGRVVTGAGQGTQIVPPYDAQILEQIEAVPSVSSVQRAESGWEFIGSDLVDKYIERITEIVPEGPRDLKIVLTSMHGVGGETAMKALDHCGFKDVTVVAEQHEPDPDFPTVAFPNPEEPGALDLSFRTAAEIDADIILANDPDADRSSAAIPDPNSASGWRQLTGDEVGSLLGEQKAREVAAVTDAAELPKRMLANSIVSSRLLSRIAADIGLGHANTLTGFKWISRVPGIVFGYEEALGYCVDPDFVRDKDGISAGTKLAALAAALKAEGRTLGDKLDEFAEKHGLHATAPLTIRVEDLSLIAKGMQNLRTNGLEEIAGSRVVTGIDLAVGSADLPPTDGLLYITERNDRVVVRPSGTEPKLKCYIEVIEPVEEGSVAAARIRAAQRLEAIKAAMAPAIGI
ncbi:phospho-sugar mutase [Actinomyces minihominis]|uniref:phospho-sugar mutase n=1 Tax=Actinomyces minihominis TaxID=2002838 RepID=UPI000C085B82|nr:phospho-sugar mutase [Actinomyces minihominis]